MCLPKFAGEVLGGLNHYSRTILGEVLPPLRQSECPFANLPDRRPNRFGEGIAAADMRRYAWVKPTFIARSGIWSGQRENVCARHGLWR